MGHAEHQAALPWHRLGAPAIIAGERCFEVHYSPERAAIQEGQGRPVQAEARGTTEQARTGLFQGASFDLTVRGDEVAMQAYQEDFGLL